MKADSIPDEILTSKAPKLTIGALARVTGIPAPTLRTWERRYGVPRPDRTEGNHRLYDESWVNHLKLVSAALEAGHRPSQVIGAEPGQLRDLLELPLAPLSEGPLGSPPDLVRQSLALARSFDTAALQGLLTRAESSLGGRFLPDLVSPLVREMGEAWSRGDLSIGAEHFASGLLIGHLRASWSRTAHLPGSPVICACLPGEVHVLGLHMAAHALARGGRRVVFLGADTPPAEIAAATRATGATGVAVSVSVTTPPDQALAGLESLRASLPPGIPLVVGGGGRPAGLPQDPFRSDLEALCRGWGRGEP